MDETDAVCGLETTALREKIKRLEKELVEVQAYSESWEEFMVEAMREIQVLLPGREDLWNRDEEMGRDWGIRVWAAFSTWANNIKRDSGRR